MKLPDHPINLYKNRVVIEWTNPRAWHQNELGKEITQIRAKGFVTDFTDYYDFVLSFDELKAILNQPEGNPEWISKLSGVSGVYLIVDIKTGRQYIGSAYSARGFLGRYTEREKPVYFQWQILEWPAPASFLSEIGLKLLSINLLRVVNTSEVLKTNELIFVDKPKVSDKLLGTKSNEFKARKSPDYALIDRNNKKLGLEGELLVLNDEVNRLMLAGRSDLADKVVHVSVVEGDGAGYDIRSFDINGNSKFIEVRTTKGSAETSFYISPNEVEFSRQNARHYHLYRLYNFDLERRNANVFAIEGDLTQQIGLMATQYKATLR